LLRMAGLLLLGIALGVAVTLGLQLIVGSSSTSPPAETAADVRPESRQPLKRSVIALGTLEPRSGPISIGSSLAGFQIGRIAVQEGQAVAQGDLLVQLDPALAEEELRLVQAQRTEAVERQRTEAEVAEQRLVTANLAVRQATEAKELELAAQQKRLDVAEVKVTQAKNDLQRLQTLRRENESLVSAQQVEHQQTLVDTSAAELAASKVALERLQQSLDFELQKAAAEQKAATQALDIAKRGTGLAALDRRIALAELKLAQTRITAPSAGTVTRIFAHPGEVVATQPLLQLADLRDMVCLAEVDVADVPLLKDKREALITCRAFHGKKLRGTIERVRNLVGSATLRPADPRQSVDRSVTTVVLAIDAARAVEHLGGDSKDAAAALMGLQVDVEIPL
jgi:ABC exporter DevB family membrane fusion protein